MVGGNEDKWPRTLSFRLTFWQGREPLEAFCDQRPVLDATKEVLIVP